MIFFNADGTCGEIGTEGNLTVCSSDCMYTFDGTTLAVSNDGDGGSSGVSSVSVVITGNTLTANPTDGGVEEQLTRVNSNASTTCP